MKTTKPPPDEHVRIISEQVLSDDWYLLRKITFDYRRRDGFWQRQAREVYDRGNGAVILLYNAARETVLLTRQFRLPAYVNGSADGFEPSRGPIRGDPAGSLPGMGGNAITSGREPPTIHGVGLTGHI